MTKILTNFSLINQNKLQASIDESDYSLHLSNSSYAKVLDGARFKAMKWCPQLFGAGGKMALGGTSFGFSREIPIMRGYEVRISIGGWDEKWGEGEDKKKHHEAMNGSFLQAPIIDTTPSSSSFTSTPIPPNVNRKIDIKTLTSRLTATHKEPDGAILHTVSISQMCCKIGRITVPPELVLTMNGMYAANDSEAYSKSNSPPHWLNVQALIESNGLTALYKGGWKDVPVEERWWNIAMGGVVEEQRKERMETLGLLRGCMDGAITFSASSAESVDDPLSESGSESSDVNSDSSSGSFDPRWNQGSAPSVSVSSKPNISPHSSGLSTYERSFLCITFPSEAIPISKSPGC
ncbi:hypothetical protein V5O48_017052 [Marasmius crinis-equi]|uniref:Uncharacterized protein n=1 Tax=Marasmius crinis-equi TaxID=585013 RepID=A0ABR3EQA1_9AGAR